MPLNHAANVYLGRVWAGLGRVDAGLAGVKVVVQVKGASALPRLFYTEPPLTSLLFYNQLF